VLVDALHDRGYAVQLEHDDVETSWEANGDVTVCAAGVTVKELMYQHNRKYSDRTSKAAEIAAQLPAPADAACPTNEQAFWGAYGKKMVAAASLPAQHGAFITNCPSPGFPYTMNRSR